MSASIMDLSIVEARSGKSFLRKPEIEALGYTEHDLPGKERFVKPLSRTAKRHLVTR